MQCNIVGDTSTKFDPKFISSFHIEFDVSVGVGRGIINIIGKILVDLV